jgi:hypothetical protein
MPVVLPSINMDGFARVTLLAVILLPARLAICISMARTSLQWVRCFPPVVWVNLTGVSL